MFIEIPLFLLFLPKDMAKKKQQNQTKKSSTAATADDITRKRPAETALAAVREKRKKITSVTKKTQGGGNNTVTGNNGDNDKRKRKKHHKKEVIDYSAIQTEKDPEPKTDPKSKVRSWLLASSQCRPPETVRINATGLLKSKSTPVGLTDSGGAGIRASMSKQVPSTRISGAEAREPKSSSFGSSAARKERARLHVVYKPPFRFSVKLRKSDKVAQAPQTIVSPGDVTVNHINIGRAAAAKLPRTGVLLRTGAKKKDRVRIGRARQIAPTGIGNASSDLPEPTNSDLHTVPSDLEVLLSESEFLFSDT